MPGRYTDEFTGHQESWPLVLHNTQLCMEAGRGRCQWSSQCLQVILFIIQMKTLFHYPWGSGSNVLMSLTHGSSFGPRWQHCTRPCHRWWERQKTDRGRQKTGNYFIPTLLKRRLPSAFLYVIIRPTRPRSRDALEDAHMLGLWWNLRCQADMKGPQHFCPSLTLVFMLHAVKESPCRDPLPLWYSMWLII